MNYLIGIDLGTSGTKTVLFDENGKAIASETVEYPLYQPQNGWAEQDPADWWNATIKTVSGVIAKSGVTPADIKGVGISGQMHGLVMLDEDGNVLRNSIIWCDGRTGEECEEITRLIGASRLIEITANPALTGFTAGKILWVRRHEKEIYNRCKRILLPKDYVRYMLTGVYSAEVTDASGTNLLDITTRKWSNEILEKLSIDKALLGEICESADVVGTVTKQASGLTGLSCDTIVVGGAGDNAAAAVGTGVVQEGRGFTTIGTSGVIFAHSDSVKIDKGGRVHTFCSATPNGYAVMSCTLAAGLSLKWFKENFCDSEIVEAEKQNVDIYALLDKIAGDVPIGANRLVYLPYLMGERSPVLDSNARGAFIGLSAIHKKTDLLRAVLEGVIYSQRDCLEVLREMGVLPQSMLACGGGGTSPLWRQMLADTFNMPVVTVQNKEGPALGVAILAGVGAGLWKTVQEGCERVISLNSPQTPIESNAKEYNRYYNVYSSLYPSLKTAYSELKNLG